ncbi:hypothetical protein D7X33_49260, partial [Butyricicoccus sp. 1XD8-22]
MIDIPDSDRQLIDQAIFLPMLLTVLQRDLAAIDKGSFKLKQPYQISIEAIIRDVQKDLAAAKRYLHKNNIKIIRGRSENNFTFYTVMYKGGEEKRSYFNDKIRNNVEDL